ncbi:MAG: TonB-dependent receptor [Flavobacterium sp.]|nr:TonB-dependent receptor [Flavobacterium sp.]
MKKLSINAFFILQVLFVFAQSATGVSGKIVDSKTQKPLVNVAVSLQNTSLFQLSDADGRFALENTPTGNQFIQVKSSGYRDQLIQVEVIAGKMTDLGVVSFQEDQTVEQQLALVTITESDLGDDNSGSESTSGLLQASRDVFQQAAAFNWGQARFRIRGLDNEYSTTMINGVSMNKIYDGRPQWSNWGGLNDATRNQEFTMGSAPSDYTFGGILGTQEINTRASSYRKGSRISFSGTNTNYSWRSMATHASGMNKKGWAFVVSASRRWAEEGYFEGTNYAANSIFASVEKKINERHSINFTSIYAQNKRGKSSPNTAEVTRLKGIEYNSFWGWQEGEKRNSRYKEIEEPINMLSHFWKISNKTNLHTNLSFQTGFIGNSRLDFQLANNPDPTYYKNLPSYYLNDPSYSVPTYGPDNVTIIGYTNPTATAAATNFIGDGQLNWRNLYYTNQIINGGQRSAYVLYEDRVQDNQWSGSSYLNSSIANNIVLNAGVSFRKLKSTNFQKLIDLLGGSYFNDIDPFFIGNAGQSDLNNPDRQVREGDAYGYNYTLHALTFDGFTQFKFTYKKIDFYLGQTFSRTEYQREGNYKNGIYANTSFGKSATTSFENFGFKGGLTYKLSGKQFFDFNTVFMTKAPNLRNTFSNARLNNNITPNLNSESIMGGDLSYIIKAPKFKARVTGFFNRISNATQISFFYGEGIFDAGEDGDTDTDSFISEIVTGINKKHIGAELGFEYQITSTVKATGSASYGQYTYDNNPNLKVNDDALATSANPNPVFDFGKAYLKNYRLPGMPQQAYSVGLEYRDPKFWWIGANVNYLDDNYLSISNILRTDNFVTDANGLGFEGATEESVRRLLKQEKFDPTTLVNLVGGKSWKVGDQTFGFFASLNNVFDFRYKTGGFEQSRKATFPDFQADNANGTPSFGPKYFYGYGRTYFLNLYINF